MGVHVIRMPDIGEGIAETEIVEWMVAPGDPVLEDQPLAAVMTDKATVEIPSPVAGRVIACNGAPGDTIAVGAELIRLEVEGEGNLGEGNLGEVTASDRPAPAPQPSPAKPAAAAPPAPAKAAAPPPPPSPPKPAAPPRRPTEAPRGTPLAAPAVRALARERGIDLRLVAGSGPEGRILREDVESFDPLAVAGTGPRANTSMTEVRVIGLRKRIAERMELANRIPHITIVEEIDATALEDLRRRLNERNKNRPDAPKLTLLPFLTRALVVAVADQPVMNARYDAEAGVLHQFGGLHIGIATQTPNGLVVPVLRHAEALDLAGTATEIARLAAACRDGGITREELSGSTITITSLGPLGAIATTPILNAPEVAIVGVNRLATRPFWTGTTFVPRQMMNISCSFDHRIIDGWDAAVFVQRLKELLETPALLFMDP